MHPFGKTLRAIVSYPTGNRTAHVAIIALIWLGATHPILAQTWDGGGSANNWSDANNWSPAGAPVNNGTASLSFNGSTRSTPNVDTPWSVNSINFTAASGGFTIGGSQLTIGSGGITSVSTEPFAEAINTPVVLSASQTWTASANFVGNGGLVAGSTINLNGFNLSVGGADGGALEGAISGTGGLTLTSGEWAVYGVNSYSGPTNVNGGWLYLTSDSALSGPTTPVNFNAGELTVNANGNTIIAHGGVISSGGATFTSDAAQYVVVTFSGNFSGPGGLTLSGGEITLSGTNSYAGGTTVESYTTLQGAAPSIQGNLDLTAVTTEVDFQQTVGGTFSGNISGYGAFAKDGAGTLSFSGTFSQTQSNMGDGLQINAGKVIMTGGSGAFTNVPLSLKNVAGAAFDLNGTNQAVSELEGGGTSGGNVLLGAGTLTIGGDNSSQSFGGAISGSGGLTKVGTGYQLLSGVNTYTGATTIDGGILRVGSATALASTTAVTLANVSGVALDLNNFSFGIGALSGGGSLGGNVTLGSGNLTLGSDNGNGSFAGLISGTGAVIKQGSGTETFSNANSYSGGTTLDQGAIAVAADSYLGKAGVALNFNGGILELDGTAMTSTARTINWSANGGGFDIANAANAFAVGQSLSGSGPLTKEGPGVLILSSSNAYLGTTIAGGTLNVNADAALGAHPSAPATNITFSGNATLQFAAGFAGPLSANRGLLVESG